MRGRPIPIRRPSSVRPTARSSRRIGRLRGDEILQVKGVGYSAETLLGGSSQGAQYADGSFVTVLPIDDYGEFEGQMYYVMPFITGETIHKRLERERQLNVQDAVKIAFQVASRARLRAPAGHRPSRHQAGEHSPAGRRSARRRFRHRARDHRRRRRELTSTGVTLGTPTYMSPEQAMADPGIDGRSDIYSLGCVLYEMLAGQPPFSGPTAQAIIARHQLDQAPSLSIVRGTIPEEVEDVVMQALAKLPADRYATAGEMAEELRNILTTGVRPAKISARRNTKNTTKRGLARAKARPASVRHWRGGGRSGLAGAAFRGDSFHGRTVGCAEQDWDGLGSESHRGDVFR